MSRTGEMLLRSWKLRGIISWKVNCIYVYIYRERMERERSLQREYIFTTKYGTRAALARVDVCAVLRCTGTKRGLVVFLADQIDHGRTCNLRRRFRHLAVTPSSPRSAIYSDFQSVKVRRSYALILPLDAKLPYARAARIVCFFFIELN